MTTHLTVLDTVSGSTMTTLFGATIPTTLSGLTPHIWVADSTGLFHTATDLAAEWEGAYAQMLAGHASSLTPILRLEGNAEAVFENSAVKNLPAAQVAVFREDAQRQFDAMAGAMAIDQMLYGIDPNAPLTQQTFLTLEHTLQGSPALQELGLQGHGLNDPPGTRYSGFTNDFQNNIDNTTRYIGGGLNNGGKVFANFFDDNILSHTPFPSVIENGRLVQLNQNGAVENTVSQQVAALDQSMYARVYKASDFTTAAPAPPTPHAPAPAAGGKLTVTAPTPPTMKTLLGYTISTTITGITPHTWVADANGLFHTTTDLAAEWQGDYAMMLDGQGGQLTAIQRLEGNAEAVFENTGLSKLSASVQEADREDAQREFDAMAAAMQIDATTLGISATAPFTAASYIALEHTMQASPVLEELAIQGHGLNKPPSARYNGFTNDFQNNVDATTKYVGGGLNNGGKAIADFFDDNIISHTPFAVVAENGKPVQLNQNGQAENTLDEAVTALNESMFYRTYLASDFKA
jgi:hypothetical protein